jgi:hypothetical protein
VVRVQKVQKVQKVQGVQRVQEVQGFSGFTGLRRPVSNRDDVVEDPDPDRTSPGIG